MLAELEGPLLGSLQNEELKGIQSLTTFATSIIWVTCGGLLSGQHPEYAMASGLARSLRSENVSLDLVTLDINPNTTTDERLAEIIVDIVFSRSNGEARTRETEYLVDNGLVHISRLIPCNQCNEMVVNRDDITLLPLKSDAALIGSIQSGDIVFQDDERKARTLKCDHVEIKVMAAGLNQEVICQHLMEPTVKTKK